MTSLNFFKMKMNCVLINRTFKRTSLTLHIYIYIYLCNYNTIFFFKFIPNYTQFIRSDSYNSLFKRE